MEMVSKTGGNRNSKRGLSKEVVVTEEADESEYLNLKIESVKGGHHSEDLDEEETQSSLDMEEQIMDSSDTIYEETVEMATDGENEEGDNNSMAMMKMEQCTDSEGDVHEVVVGQEEEVTEQSLDEILISKPEIVMVSTPSGMRNANIVRKTISTVAGKPQQQIVRQQIVRQQPQQQQTIIKRINQPVMQKLVMPARNMANNLNKPQQQTVVLKKPNVITAAANSANKPQTIKIISSSGQKIISVPKLSNIRFTSVNPGQQLAKSPMIPVTTQQHHVQTSIVQQMDQNRMPMKRKSEGSPLIVKLDNLKRVKTIPTSIVTPSAPIAIRSLGSSNSMATKFIRVIKNCHTQTDICGEILDQYQQIIEEDQQKIAVLEDQMRKLKYTPEMFENDDKRTEYFTGLDSFVTMITLFNTCENELPMSSTLTKFEIYILTLLKLRLKLPLQYLGYQFGVTPKAAHFYFNECLSVLHRSLRELFNDDAADMEMLA